MSAASSYSRGIELFRRGRYDQAVAVLCTVTDEPGLIGRLARFYQAQACRQAGVELARAGNLVAAQEYLQRTIRLIGTNADLAHYLARLYTQMGLHDRAEAHYDAAASHRDSPAVRAALARAQHRAGRSAQAMITLGEALHAFPDAPELHVQAGLMLARDERYAAAADEFRRAIECDCLCDEAHYHLGLCEAAQGRCAEAARHLERALQLRPHDVLLAYQLALTARAAADAGQSILLRLPEASTPSGQTYMQQLADFVAREADFVAAFLSLPPSEADEELFGLLSAVLDTALADHGDYADLHLRQSLVQRRLGNADKSVAHARRAVEINADFVQARIQLAGLLAEQAPADAVRHYEHAVRSGGDYADVHAALGDLYDRLGRPDHAAAALRRALEINCNYSRAREALRRLAA